ARCRGTVRRMVGGITIVPADGNRSPSSRRARAWFRMGILERIGAPRVVRGTFWIVVWRLSTAERYPRLPGRGRILWRAALDRWQACRRLGLPVVTAGSDSVVYVVNGSHGIRHLAGSHRNMGPGEKAGGGSHRAAGLTLQKGDDAMRVFYAVLN